MAKWDPFTDGFRLVERFGGRFRDDGWDLGLDDGGEDDAANTPPTDVFEDREGWTYEVELPGVPTSEVSVRLAGDTVIIEAERGFRHAGERQVHALEGRYGRMRRTFALPFDAEPDKALAELRSGVLRIFVPRRLRTATVDRALDVATREDGTDILIE